MTALERLQKTGIRRLGSPSRGFRYRSGRLASRVGRPAAAQERRREDHKKRRLLLFLEALPRLRAQVARDLRRSGLPRERVLAGAVRILMRCYVRPGSRAVPGFNGSLVMVRPTNKRG